MSADQLGSGAFCDDPFFRPASPHPWIRSGWLQLCMHSLIEVWSFLECQRALLISFRISLTSGSACFSLNLLWSQVEVLRMLILPTHQQTQFLKVFFHRESLHSLYVKVWAGLTTPLFSVKEGGGGDRLQQRCSISKQLLNEWQSQGLVIWTWENSEEAARRRKAAGSSLYSEPPF